MGSVGRIRGQTEKLIRRSILQAIFEQRMPPGARLTEDALADTFEVSRTIIRQVIARLAQDGILIKDSSGATHIASPSRQEAKQILDVRRMIEPKVVRTLADRAADLSFADLQAHLEAEDKARKQNDRGGLVRLTGEFHLLLVQHTQNAILVRLMTELQALICLAILLYASGEDACPEDEHRRIVDAIRAGDGARAEHLMLHHLDHIERDLKLDDLRPDVQIESALTWLSGRRSGD
ncbi:GntR family transcriptional regulator [Methylobacterium brachythecii]|uniref:GntR family transcriptional regulator n=1 Tax=Methylobacterium brachythecii TaxID=1176177 RepID=A0A7W6AHZ2_9HYPH|nr:GntR family transcriptional regulator [Methylobacterium brachythecii]MBB3903698.1 DNA-binding GntR family transcriptional regulator [Methylobacterium brachythecii]GLS44269.1 GntR family transcriptional regulator [Methylobacterium brachythecii]